MGESHLATAASAGKAASVTTMAYLAAHPIGAAVAGGVLIGLGAYYLGKTIANRQNKATKAEPAAAPAAA